MTATKPPLTVACPVCKKAVVWSDANPFRPFCCERCKLIDLGDWASESHRIAGDPVLDDFMSEDEPLKH